MRSTARSSAARQGVADELLGGLRVEVSSRLVEHEDWSVREQRAGERDPLTLTSRELSALLADECVPAVRKL